MPLYTYVILDKQGKESNQTIEIFQSMKDSPLTTLPNTNTPIKKVITAPYIGGSHSERRIKSITSNENIARKGFTKYQRDKNGTYHKVAGNLGPSSFSN